MLPIPENENSTLAFVFAGQGSQSVGMLADLGAAFPVVKETFDATSEILGFDLWKLTQQGPEDTLNQTGHTQPAMFAAGIAVWRVWLQQGGPRPRVLAGHSLGEFTALACANTVDFRTAVELVAHRARLMREAVPEGVGTMAAILGLDATTVVDICTREAGDEVVAAVNFNSPLQVVIAGHVGAVERVIGAAKEVGAKRAITLPVSVPSHCQLMEPAAKKFANYLNETEIHVPSIPVLANVYATPYTNEISIRQGLTTQLHGPVRWVETIESMTAHGIKTVLECGPGRVLTGLNKRIDKSMQAMPIVDPKTLDDALEVVRKVIY